MHRSLLLVATGAGLTATLALACSGTSDPSTDLPSAALAAAALSTPTLTPQHSGTTNRLQAVSPVSANVVWASGTGGTFTRTTNGGKTWRAGVVSGARDLEFRDIQGVSADVAYLLAAGPGEASRIYKTTNGGRSWQLQFKNEKPKGFYDCFAFWDPDRGITMADAIGSRFPALRTRSGGKNWAHLGDRMPAAQPGEAAFAASGTCVATFGQDRAWIATGGAAKARIFRTTDAGDTWHAFSTPIPHGTGASGNFTVEFRDALHGIVAGGDLERPFALLRNVAISSDGGRTWRLVEGTPFGGAAFGLSYIHGAPVRGVVITGPNGAAWSADEGHSWHRLAGVKGYWAVAFANPRAGWLVGTEGRILKVSF
jgi:photosystem II stability/assembly factor-like uncharacterized protein